jgi:hypothetical protein
MQIPTQPPQAEVEIAKKRIRVRLAEDPGYLITPHGLVKDGVVDPYEAADGHPLDVAIAAIDDLGAETILEQIGLDTFILR